MLTGKPPFLGQSDYLIFEQIRRGQLVFPEGMCADGVSLIQNLLKQNPEERLGTGTLGSANDLEALKNHPFFEGLDIENIFNCEVPIEELPKVTRAESDDEHEIYELNKRVEPNTSIIMSGIVKKKAGWVYKKRQLTVTKEPRISYSTLENVHKGNVPICGELKAEAKGTKEFTIVTPNRTYFFKALLDNSQAWVDAVNKLIDEKFH